MGAAGRPFPEALAAAARAGLFPAGMVARAEAAVQAAGANDWIFLDRVVRLSFHLSSRWQ